MLRLFFVKPVARAAIELHWQNQLLQNKTEDDGFIKFEWASEQPVAAGWHPVSVRCKNGKETVTGEGELFVPHKTQYGFISDIDDTIMISHSATVFKRLRILFATNPHTRKIFDDVQKHYHLLSVSNTHPEAPNPFFYVSSSEWNLYDYLEDFFAYNNLPRGAFLLNHVKQWTELLQTGKTKHEGKLIRVTRILQTFPHQQFILIGDNTQRDPVIYKAIAEKYTKRIHAVYIRNVLPANEATANELLSQLQQHTGIHTCLFTTSNEAIEHSRSIGLIR
ncbi:MAG TPA: App1 family protein [Chitinophagaceae bacterium]|nr:App1 family protein [Chitinophagaceae bacterium]